MFLSMVGGSCLFCVYEMLLSILMLCFSRLFGIPSVFNPPGYGGVHGHRQLGGRGARYEKRKAVAQSQHEDLHLHLAI